MTTQLHRAIWLPVRVITRARRTELRGTRDGEVVVALTAPPVAGAANATLVGFIAKQLGLRKSAVTIARGATARHKVLQIEGATAVEVRATLGFGEADVSDGVQPADEVMAMGPRKRAKRKRR